MDESRDRATVLKGWDAGLAFLHQRNTSALACAITNVQDILLGPLSVKLCVQEEETGEDEDETPTTTKNDDFDSTTATKVPTASFGGFLLLVTKQAVLLWRISKIEYHPDDDDGEYIADLYVPGSCIDLQAITTTTTAEDVGAGSDIDAGATVASGVYLQVTDADEKMLEINIKPDDGGGPDVCEEIYRAVAKLIELHPHPVFSDDDDDDDDDDEMIMGSDFVVTPATPGAVTSTDEHQREQMLERLSNLLVVPPEYEIVDDDDIDEATANDDGDVVEGQFDDAEDDDDPFL